MFINKVNGSPVSQHEACFRDLKLDILNRCDSVYTVYYGKMKFLRSGQHYRHVSRTGESEHT